MTKKLLKAILSGQLSAGKFIQETTPIEWSMVRRITPNEKTVRVYNNRGFDRTYTAEEWKEVADQFPSFIGGPITITYFNSHEKAA